MLAIDFDNTLVHGSVNISIEHIVRYHQTTLSGAVDIYVKERGNPFSPYVEQLQGPMVVVSFGYHTVIRKLLKMFGHLGKVCKIYTPRDFGLKEGHNHRYQLQGKNQMLQLVADEFKLRPIMLVDDDWYNIERAHKAGYATCQVEPPAGVSATNLKKIQQFQKKSGQLQGCY